jgi:hypothetical protein
MDIDDVFMKGALSGGKRGEYSRIADQVAPFRSSWTAAVRRFTVARRKFLTLSL